MDNLFSLAIYLSVFALAAICVYLGEKTKRNSLIAVGLLIPILLAGLRYMVGIDYENYANIAHNLSGLSIADFFSSGLAGIYEPTMYLFSKLSYLLFSSDTIFFAAYASLAIIPFYFAIRRLNPKYSWLAVLLFLLIFFAPALNTIRQFAAIGIAFYAVIDYFKPKPQTKLSPRTRFIIIILLAASVHVSALCMLLLVPLYFLAQKLSTQKPLKQIIVYSFLAIALFAIAAFLIDHINSIPILNKYSYYVNWIAGGDAGPTPNLIAKIFPIVVASIFLRPLIRDDKINALFYGFLYVALAMSMLGLVIPYGYRFADYFSIFQIPLFLSIIKISRPISRQKVYALILVAYGLTYFLYSAFYNNSYGVFPYQLLSLT